MFHKLLQHDTFTEHRELCRESLQNSSAVQVRKAGEERDPWSSVFLSACWKVYQETKFVTVVSSNAPTCIKCTVSLRNTYLHVQYSKWESVCSCAASSSWWLFISLSLTTTSRGLPAPSASKQLPAPVEKNMIKRLVRE